MKNYRQIQKNVVLFFYKLGGDIISKLLIWFFFFYLINFIIILYSIYTFFEIYFFHNLQGSKLNLKKQLLKKNKKRILNYKL